MKPQKRAQPKRVNFDIEKIENGYIMTDAQTGSKKVFKEDELEDLKKGIAKIMEDSFSS